MRRRINSLIRFCNKFYVLEILTVSSGCLYLLFRSKMTFVYEELSSLSVTLLLLALACRIWLRLIDRVAAFAYKRNNENYQREIKKARMK